MSDWDAIVIGGGAAGLFCAATAGRRGKRVVVLDHADKIGRKILISGGGRCNFTNRSATADNYISGNPHFARSALARYTPDDFLALVQRHGIGWHERKHGQLFCDDSAKHIVAMLLAECDAAGVTVTTGCQIQGVAHDGGFRVATNLGPQRAPKLVLATGGLSVAPTGATDFGHRLARQFGLTIRRTDPGLVPLTTDPGLGLGELSGIAVDARLTCDGVEFQENLLFTHGGLSGPAVLQVSNYWQSGATIEADLLPGLDARELLSAARSGGSQAQVATVIAEHLPKRLVQRRLAGLSVDAPAARLGNGDIAAIADALHHWEIRPTGTEGYRKAEVTRGGIDTKGLSSQTMEARTVPGLYAIGEVVDVTGWLGGYNFQWAWASGHAAGQAL